MGCSNSKAEAAKKTKGATTARPPAPPPRARSSVLSVAHCRDIPSDTLARKIAEHSTRLTVIKMDGVMLGDIGAAALARALVHGRHAASLRALRVSTCNVGSEGATSLVGCLLATSIVTFDLSGNAVRSDGVKALVAAIRGRTAKRGAGTWGPPGTRVEVRLSGNPLVGTPPHVGVAALAELAHALATVPRRKALELRNVGLRFDASTSTHGARLVETLSRGRFEAVDLRANDLDDAFAALLASDLLASQSKTRIFDGDDDEDDDDDDSEGVPALTPEVREIYRAACRLDPASGAAAHWAAFHAVDVDEVDGEVGKKFGGVNVDALAATLVGQGGAPAWIDGPTVLRIARGLDLVVQQQQQHQHEEGLLVDLERWRCFLRQVAARLSPSTQHLCVRLDLRLNPLSPTAVAALTKAWVALRSKEADAEPQILLIDPVVPARLRRPERARGKNKVRILKAPGGESASSRFSSEDGGDDDAYSSSSRHLVGGYEETKEEEAAAAPAPTHHDAPYSPRRQAHRRWVFSVESARVDVRGHLARLGLDDEVDWTAARCEPAPRRPDLPRFLVTATARAGDFAWDWLDEELAETLGGDGGGGDDGSQQEPSGVTFIKMLDEAERSPRLLGPGEMEMAAPSLDSDASKKKKTTTTAPPHENDLVVAAPPVNRRPKNGLSPAAIKVVRLLVIFEDSGHDLREAFQRLDASGDGEISVTELFRGLKALPGGAFDDVTKADVAAIVADASAADGDEHVSPDELAAFVTRGRAALGLAAAVRRPLLPGQRHASTHTTRLAKLLMIYEDAGNGLDDAFRRFDTSGDGEISVAELHAGLTKLGNAFEGLDRHEVETVVRESFGKENDVTLQDLTSFVHREREIARRGGD